MFWWSIITGLEIILAIVAAQEHLAWDIFGFFDRVFDICTCRGIGVREGNGQCITEAEDGEEESEGESHGRVGNVWLREGGELKGRRK